jgi:hypothetical protein
VIRTDLASLYRGEATLSYERLFAQQMLGIEGGFGIDVGEYSPGYLADQMEIMEYDLSGASSTNSVFLDFRFYGRTIQRSGYLFTLGFRNQGFNYESADINTFRLTDVSTHGGLHLLLFNRVVLDATGGVVFRFMSDTAFGEIQKMNPNLLFSSEIFFRLGLSAGYLF